MSTTHTAIVFYGIVASADEFRAAGITDIRGHLERLDLEWFGSFTDRKFGVGARLTSASEHQYPVVLPARMPVPALVRRRIRALSAALRTPEPVRRYLCTGSF